MTRLLFILPIAFLCAVHAEQPKPKVTLCVGNYQTEAQAVEQLKRMAATHGNLAQWKVRAAAVRQQVLRTDERRLLKEGVLGKVRLSKTQARHVFLCNDVLLYAARPAARGQSYDRRCRRWR